MLIFPETAAWQVPIVKYVDVDTKIKVDVSMFKDSGLASAAAIKSFIQVYPAARSLVFVLKQFLLQRNLNEASARVTHAEITSSALLISRSFFFCRAYTGLHGWVGFVLHHVSRRQLFAAASAHTEQDDSSGGESGSFVVRVFRALRAIL
jgi:hypothetical protein